MGAHPHWMAEEPNSAFPSGASLATQCTSVPKKWEEQQSCWTLSCSKQWGEGGVRSILREGDKGSYWGIFRHFHTSLEFHRTLLGWPQASQAKLWPKNFTVTLQQWLGKGVGVAFGVAAKS